MLLAPGLGPRDGFAVAEKLGRQAPCQFWVRPDFSGVLPFGEGPGEGLERARLSPGSQVRQDLGQAVLLLCPRHPGEPGELFGEEPGSAPGVILGLATQHRRRKRRASQRGSVAAGARHDQGFGVPSVQLHVPAFKRREDRAWASQERRVGHLGYGYATMISELLQISSRPAVQ